MLNKVSAVIITNNEASNIRQCLAQLKKVVNEIVVVDSFSTDDTVNICTDMGAIVFQRKWSGYGTQKNFGHEQANFDWILSIDADEVLSDSLVNTLNNINLEQDHVYLLDRHNYFGETRVKYSGWHPDWKPRLFNKKKVNWNHDHVHEKLIIPQEYTAQKISGALLHYSYKNDQDHLNRMERYAELMAIKMIASKKKVTFLKKHTSPLSKFIITYFLKLGILDGKLGLKIAYRNFILARMKFRKHEALKKDSR